MAELEWWQNFFAEPWSKIQGGGYAEERTAAECDLIQRALQLRDGARVLDIPCGIGRHTIELARRGFRMAGVDFNPEYVASARAAAAQAKIEAEFVVCDMRTFASAGAFDAVSCYFGSFGYFDDDGNQTFLRAAATNLRGGGRLLIEGHIAETLLPIYRERDWSWAGPPNQRVRVLEERSWNIETGRIEGTWTIVGEAETLSSSSSIRIYAYRELRELLLRAGFVAVDLLDGASGESFRIGSPRALVVAQLS